MSITNSIKNRIPGLGYSSLNYKSGNSSTVSSLAVTVTLALATGQSMNHGKLRFKASGVTGDAIASYLVTGTDGTTTITLERLAVNSGTSGQGMERSIDFDSDLDLNSFTVTVKGGASLTAMVVDAEVSGS